VYVIDTARGVVADTCAGVVDAEYPLDAVNEHLGLTVAQILAADTCPCGHDLEAHLEDGLLEAPTGCAAVYGDRSCLCRGWVDPDVCATPDQPDDEPDWWDA
jgi:hypothetical protein